MGPRLQREKTPNSQRRQLIMIMRYLTILGVTSVIVLPFIFTHLSSPAGTTDQCPITVYHSLSCAQEPQNSLMNTSDVQNVLSSSNQAGQNSHKRNFLQAIHRLIEQNASQECAHMFTEWLCMGLYLLCDDNCTNSTLTELFGEDFNSSCPKNQNSVPCENSFFRNISDAMVLHMSDPLKSPIMCNDQFYFDNLTHICLPECGKWTYVSHTTDRILKLILISGTLFGIVISVAVLLALFFLHKKMFTFPSIFIIYLCISLLIYSCFDVATRIDRESTVCASKNLLKNIEEVNVPFYCKLVGALFLYTRFQAMLWWMFQMGTILFGVHWPMQYRTAKDSGKLRFAHMSMIFVGLVLPLVPVFLSYGLGGYGIAVVWNYSCIPTNNMSILVYSYELPMTIFAIISLSMLVFIASDISIKRHRRDAKADSFVPEVKLIIIFSIFTIAYQIATCTTAVFMWRARLIQTDLQAYFQCEAVGVIPGQECSRDSFNPIYSISIMITYLLPSVIPLTIILVFIFDTKLVRKCLHFTRTHNLLS